jgi:FlaA1/EpsC-like NDP-sugar epimerase
MRARRELSNFFRPPGVSQPASHATGAERINPPFPARALEIIDVLSAIVSVLVAFLITNLNTMPADVGGFLGLRVSVKNLLLTAVFSLAWTSVFRAFGLYEKRTHGYSGLRLIAANACASVFALLFVLTSRAGTFRINGVFLTWIIALSLTIAARLASKLLRRRPDEPASSSGAIIGSGPARCG